MNSGRTYAQNIQSYQNDSLDIGIRNGTIQHINEALSTTESGFPEANSTLLNFLSTLNDLQTYLPNLKTTNGESSLNSSIIYTVYNSSSGHASENYSMPFADSSDYIMQSGGQDMSDYWNNSTNDMWMPNASQDNMSFHNSTPMPELNGAINSKAYWAFALLIFPLMAIFGNVLVILGVIREKNLQSVTNYFIISLAFADLLVAVAVMPFGVYALVSTLLIIYYITCIPIHYCYYISN